MSPDPLTRELRETLAKFANENIELKRQLADLERHNAELRDAIIALMELDTPRVLHNHRGVIILDEPLPPR